MRSQDEKQEDRTQGRAYLPDHLVRVNDAAKRSRQTRFTALLHPRGHRGARTRVSAATAEGGARGGRDDG